MCKSQIFPILLSGSTSKKYRISQHSSHSSDSSYSDASRPERCSGNLNARSFQGHKDHLLVPCWLMGNCFQSWLFAGLLPSGSVLVNWL
ncbi:hypothetical protein ISN45_At05g021010 [Arabidopsis thaliana x Arabidopsis arenosa]|uniref:Uncharacterized protein n=1 Tax=Arabidopsis thaliana x Arabidopsis arenosa TaxID=1240361 RepID=A0A8T2CZE3_9BRAS|nr:hypothetical protein ISN45_At05g021010 [Arabidopsis thaliana x Arabidopsis arenosa]